MNVYLVGWSGGLVFVWQGKKEKKERKNKMVEVVVVTVLKILI